MRRSRGPAVIALLGSTVVLASLVVAPAVRATAIIDTISLSTNKPWSLAADQTSVYVGLQITTQPEVLKVNPIDATYSAISMPPVGGVFTWVARGAATDDSLYASVNNNSSGSVVRMSITDDTWHAVRSLPLALSDLAVKSTNGSDDTVYVSFAAGVLALDPVTLQTDDSIPLPSTNNRRDIALIGDDSIIVTQPVSSGGVYIISARSRDDSALVPLRNPSGVAVSPDNQWAYVAAESGFPGDPFLFKLNTRTGSIDDSVGIPGSQVTGRQVAVAPDGTVYATSDQVKVLVAPQGSFAQATTVTMLNIPDSGLAVSPNGRAYVGNMRSIGGVFNGQLQVLGSLAPPPGPSPTPANPPGAPTNVVAKGGWKSVVVDWSAPADQGSFPITTYLVKASPGGQMCLARRSDANPTQCAVTNLTPGTQYTFQVQALNGGGWGAPSAASNAATPYDLRITSQQRKARTFLFVRLGTEVQVSGTSLGYPARTPINVWIKEGNGGSWVQQAGAQLTTNSSGRYSWSRNFGRNKDNTPIWVRFSIGDDFSNEVVLPPVR